MNELMVSQQRIKTLETQELKKLLVEGIQITARQLYYLSMIWKELEERGEDLSAFKKGLAVYLPDIARGILDANVVVKFAHLKILINAIKTLPINQQKKLTEDNCSLPVLIETKDGGYMEKNIPVNAMSSQQVKQVFNGGKILDIKEQEKLNDRAIIKEQIAVIEKNSKCKVEIFVGKEHLKKIEAMEKKGIASREELLVFALENFRK